MIARWCRSHSSEMRPSAGVLGGADETRVDERSQLRRALEAQAVDDRL